jgi:hypothetical protein
MGDVAACLDARHAGRLRAQENPERPAYRTEARARYDNSAANRANPDPTAEVAWGDQTWEEMLAGFIDLAVAEGTDPRNVVGPPASRDRR